MFLSENDMAFYSQTQSVVNFRSVTENTQCLFAKRAVTWGSPEYNQTLTIEQNIIDCLPSLIKFVKLADQGEKLDAFVIEIRDKRYGKSEETLAALVRIVLQVISRNCPTGLSCMDMKSIVTPRWYFSLCSVPIFITTFGPCYSQYSSRYAFPTPATADSVFILFQPEESFLRHGLDFDTPHTNWENPITIRDRVRVNFRAHNRQYNVGASTNRVASYNIVLANTATIEQQGEIQSKPLPLLPFWDEKLFPDFEH